MSANLQDLVKRRDELLMRKQLIITKQTQADTSFSNDTDIFPGPSTSSAYQTVPLESISAITCESTNEQDFSGFLSNDSVADPDFVLPIDELVGNIRSPTVQSPVLKSPLLQLEDTENFPERSIVEEQTSTSKRKRIADKDSWKIEGNKRQRMMGKEYLGFRKIDGKYVQDIAKPERKLEIPCSSQRCTRSKVFHCDTFTEEMRKKQDFSGFLSDDSVADPDFVLPIDELVGSIRSPTVQSPVLESPLLQLEDIENFPERSIVEEQTSTRKRKRIADKESWKREGNKRQRMMGKEYLGFRKIDGKYVQDIARPERKLEMPCSSQRCTTSKVFHCDTFTEEMRKKIFDDFWARSWKEKKLYVLTLIDTQDTQRKTKGAGSRRSESKIYHLKATNKKVRVCQSMFLGTLGIKEWTCRYWLGERGHRGYSQEASVQADQLTKKLSVLNFLQEIPKLPSHYCRKSSQKLYLEPIIQSKAHLYRLYVERTNSLCSPVAGRKFFEDLLAQQNIAIFRPKKDECDTCCAHKAGNLSDEEHKIHLSLKTAARQEKNKDKEAAIKGEVHVVTADLQAVMLCPYLNASALYFKTKLCVHNFTVYNLSNHKATCYWFDETVTDLKATTYASFFIDYITNLVENDPKDVIIYTDGCTAQNRNNVVSNALLRLANKYNVTITQKFLEKGHTQMEVDSVHSVIERKLKNREIHLPSQYALISKEARIKPFPYDVVMPDYTFFKDYSRKDYLVYESIRPGRVAGDRCVTDIRVLRYNTNGTIDYKLMYSDEYMRLPRRAKPIESLLLEPPQLHDGPQKITKTKFNHLQELKTVIPNDCHEFYNNLIFDD